MKAKVARFYGWTDEIIENLDVQTFNEYYLCIASLQNQELIMKIQAASFPNMSKSERNKMFQALKNSINIIEDQNRAFMTTEDIAKELQRKFTGGH